VFLIELIDISYSHLLVMCLFSIQYCSFL